MSKEWYNTPLWRELQTKVVQHTTTFAQNRGVEFFGRFALRNGLQGITYLDALELFIEVETTRLYIDRMEHPHAS